MEIVVSQAILILPQNSWTIFTGAYANAAALNKAKRTRELTFVSF
jgi:hypothetical protein